MMATEVQRRWTDAPLVGVSLDDRWLRFSAGRGPVYLQRYAWDEETCPHYLVVKPRADGHADQVRYATFDEALVAVQALIREDLPAHPPVAIGR